MKTKLVYIIVSTEHDLYFEEIIMSIYSFRLYHPKDKIEVIMDIMTHNRIKNKITNFQDENIKCIVIDVPDRFDEMQKSRYLKTKLRDIVKGDFIYIDGDTIICGDLSKIDKINADIAMVSDRNLKFPLKEKDRSELNTSAGFPMSEIQPYYNGGVAIVKDCHLTHQLYEAWHDLWLLSLSRGISKDQPALCQANKNLGNPIEEISSIWNYQLQGGIVDLLNAKILHYYNITNAKEWCLQSVKKNGITPFISFFLKHPKCFIAIIFLKRKNRDYYYKLREFIRNLTIYRLNN